MFKNFLMFFIVIFSLSGCENGFEPAEVASENIAGDDSLNPTTTTTVTTTTQPDSSGIEPPQGDQYTLQDIYFKVTNPGVNDTYQWSHSLSGETDQCITQDMGEVFEVFCRKAGVLTVKLTINGSIEYSSVPIQLQSSIEKGEVEFVIKEGTSNGPWNSLAKMITIRVGDTFVVTSEDSTRDNHCMHTSGNAPTEHCPIGAPLSKGESHSFEVLNEHDSSMNPEKVYDHFVDSSATFFVKSVALDGEQLYANNCSSCHGALTSSEMKNKMAWQIQDAIFRNKGNMRDYIGLTEEEVGAIARELQSN